MIANRVRSVKSPTFRKKGCLRPRIVPSCTLLTAVSLLSFSVGGGTFGLLSSTVSSTSLTETSSSSSCLYMSTFTVAQFRSRSDNYGYLLHDEETGATAAIDTPDAQDYQKELTKRGWKLTNIFNTHHHFDHVGGNLELKKDGVTITGPINEKNKIPGIDIAVRDGDKVRFGNVEGLVIDVGGHTTGHVAYLFPQQRKVFVGDALFSLGCGKMFEGTPSQFWDSLQRLRQLPDDTMVYCGHEYTESNARFAMSVEPNNPDLVARVAVVKQKRGRGEPTVPSLLGEEKKANPFLRVDFSEEIRSNVGITKDDTPAQAFGKLRRAKDVF